MNAFWTVLKVHINESGMKISNIILRSLPLMNWFYPPATFGPFAMLPASLDQLQSCYDISVSQMHGLIPLSKRYKILKVNYFDKEDGNNL